MSTIDLQPVKGTRDFYPEDMRVRTWLFGLWRQVAQRFGYEEYDACVLESEELYIRKAGDEITAQLYNFTDKGDRRVALRPELTPSFARMVMAKGSALPLPARWFAIPQCFRYEQAQRGRKREHFQWNMDIVGLSSVAAEAELIAAQVEFLRLAGLNVGTEKPDIIWRVSNRQIIQFFLENLGITAEHFAAFCVVIDKRDKIGNDKTRAELGKLVINDQGQPLSDEGITKILSLLDVRGMEQLANVVDKNNPGVVAITELMTLAEASGIAHLIRIDLSVIRGLSYYTGTVWEVFDATGTMPRAIAGGGRYDRLIEMFGGKATPMVGFGFGDVVITDILRERNLLPPLPRGIDDVVYPMSAQEFPVAFRIAAHLRSKGRNVVLDSSERRFKHVIGRAEADGAKRLLILGGNEVAQGVCKVRLLGGGERSESDVPLKELGV